MDVAIKEHSNSDKYIGHVFKTINDDLRVKPLSIQDAESYQFAPMQHDSLHIKVLDCCEKNISYLKKIHVDITAHAEMRSYGHCVIVAFLQFHNQKSPWSCQLCSNAVHNVLQSYLGVLQFKSVSDFLTEHHSFIKKTLSILCADLTRKSWKCHPQMYTSLIAFLQLCPWNSLTNYLPEIFPIVLWLVDDFFPKIVLLGIDGISAMFNCIPKAELRLYGRAEVFYDVLRKKLYFTDTDVVQKVLPCILYCISVLERDPSKTDSVHAVTRYDKIFQIVLSNLGLCTNLSMIRIYLIEMQAYISVMQLTIVRHFKNLIPLIEKHLESADAETYNETVAMVSLICKVAWPRFERRFNTILKLLIKRLLQDNFSEDKSIQKTVECISCMQKCDPSIQKTLDEIRHLSFTNKYSHLQHALELLSK